MLLFGAKHGDNEIGPPQLRFRRLAAGKNDQGPDCIGFGIVIFERRSLTY